MTTLSDQQREAMNVFSKWFEQPYKRQRHFYIGGYAGTGKTTLAKHILGTLPDDIAANTVVMAPTGKAADVLRRKGLHTATTIHSAIYKPMSVHAHRIYTLRNILKDQLYANDQEKTETERELGELVQKGPSFQSDEAAFTANKKLFIVDEFSMVGSRLYDDLIKLDVPILALGDPGQLPPVKDAKPPFVPDYTMTEIHRQAAGNPVIKLAHQARMDGYVEPGDYGESSVILPRDYDSKILIEHDQIISFTHKTRRMINKRVRELKGYTDIYPMEGEKLVCKYNDRDLKLYNGAMYTALRDSKVFEAGVDIGIKDEDGRTLDHVPVYNVPFLEYVKTINAHDKLSKDEMDNLQQFDFGYCITGHASQGSEFDSVLVIDESHLIKNMNERKQWLYTAITRAAKRVTIYKR